MSRSDGMAEKHSTSTVKVAFFKDTAWKSRYAKLITWWTNAKKPHNYFHTELVFPNGEWFSSGTTENMKAVFKPPYAYDQFKDHIDFVELELHDERIEEMYRFAKDIEGADYDWKGIILSQIINLQGDDPKRWFCSEVVTRLLQIGGVYPLYFVRPNQISPIRLYNKLVEITKNG